LSVINFHREIEPANTLQYQSVSCIIRPVPVAVDENTVSFKVMVSFKTYNPMKPVKFGLKMSVLSEISSSHGGEYDVQSCLLGYTAV
jgi:hypothetical protein